MKMYTTKIKRMSKRRQKIAIERRMIAIARRITSEVRRDLVQLVGQKMILRAGCVEICNETLAATANITPVAPVEEITVTLIAPKVTN